jgi:hypothetical protein
MDQPLSLEQQIENAVAGLTASSLFSDGLWLTFYLAGPAESLAELAGELAQAEWMNLSGSESGFIYPKIRARLDGPEIVEIAQSMMVSCRKRGCELLNIDADTSATLDSTFVPLFIRCMTDPS